MSYEGYEELLCGNGHYFAHDCYGDAPETCPRCGAPWAYSHGVDQTNGYDEECPNTYSAAKAVVGLEDDWNNDHYGNRYATQTKRYAPAPGSQWRLIRR